MKTTDIAIRTELTVFVETLELEFEKYCKELLIDREVLSQINQSIKSAKAVLCCNTEDNIAVLSQVTQDLFELINGFMTTNDRLLQMVDLIDAVCIKDKLSPIMNKAIVDGLTHQCQKLIIQGESYEEYLIEQIKTIKEM